MKIIEPSVELIDDIDGAQILRKLERCGRISRKSQPRNPVAEPRNDSARPDAIVSENQVEPRKSVEELRNDSAANFVRSIIKRGHESVLEHVSLTFHIVCDRAIMAELTRHRLASFTVESTRYIKNDELTFIKPAEWQRKWIGDEHDGYEPFCELDVLENFLHDVECAYRKLLYFGAKPEIARAVLPLCLATELYMTANLRELRHILKLRTASKVNAAHPQMRVVAGQILDILREKLPVIVEDI